MVTPTTTMAAMVTPTTTMATPSPSVTAEISNVAVPAGDADGVTTTLAISDPRSGVTISKVTLALDIQSDDITALVITLTHPDGTAVVLIDDLGASTGSGLCSIAGLDIILDEDAATDLTDDACPVLATDPLEGNFSTVGNKLNGFNGKAPTGDWSLTVLEENGSAGTINSATLTVTSA